MGRSVDCPSNALVRAFRTLETGRVADEDDVEMGFELGEWIEELDAYDMLIEDIQETCKGRWPSLRDADGWIGRENRILLENNLVRVGASMYGNVVCVWIVPHDDDVLAGLAQRWADRAVGDFCKFFAEMNPIARASNGEVMFQRIKG